MRANILCAGMGTRFRPLTFIKPKSHIEIGGVRLIERIIMQLLENNVTDITLVTGYMHEAFLYLKDKYNVELIFSDEYATKNNSSSLKLVRHRLEDSIIIDSDLYLQRPVVPLLKPNVSQFLSQDINGRSEWGLEYDNDLRITNVNKWVKSGYGMIGVSYWTGEGARLLAEEIMFCGDDEYWEDAAIRVLAKTPIYITKVAPYAVEIDSLYEAMSANLITADEIAMQCCEGCLPEKLKGLTNNTFKIKQNGQSIVLRIPGEGTEKIINRGNEEYVTSLLTGHDITPPTQFYDGGIKTMSFLENYRTLEKDTLTKEEIVSVAHKLRKLHSIKVDDIPDNIEKISMLGEAKLYENITQLQFLEPQEQQFIYQIAQQLDDDIHVICHRDLLLENVLTDGLDIQLIDFEYAFFTSKYWDIVSFITESRIEGELRASFLEAYGNLDMKKVLQAEILIDYIWGLWGFYQKYYAYARGRISMFDSHLKYFLDKYPFSI